MANKKNKIRKKSVLLSKRRTGKENYKKQAKKRLLEENEELLTVEFEDSKLPLLENVKTEIGEDPLCTPATSADATLTSDYGASTSGIGAQASGIGAQTSGIGAPTSGIGATTGGIGAPTSGIGATTDERGASTSEDEASTSSLHEEFDIIVKEEPEELEESASVNPAPLELYVGRRVVAITYFLAQLKKISSHSPSCSFGDLKISSEVKVGLMSMLTFKCSLCSETFVVECDSDNSSIASKLLTLKT